MSITITYIKLQALVSPEVRPEKKATYPRSELNHKVSHQTSLMLIKVRQAILSLRDQVS